MDWITNSSEYRFLKSFEKNALPNNSGKQKLLRAISWALKTLEEQGIVLDNIDNAFDYEEIKCINFKEKSKPKLRLILGGKHNG